MKNYLLSILCVFISIYSWADDRQLEVKSEIKKVVVFLNGAEINRSSDFQLPQGRTDIRIKSLSTQIHPKSIQASISGNARILSITTEKNYLNPHQNLQRVERLNDSLLLLKDQISQLTTEINDIDEERSMILANKSRLGEKGGVTVTELQSASLFFKKRLKEISKEKFTINQKVRKLSKVTTRIAQQLKTDNTLKDHPSNIIIIKVENPRAQKAALDFSYVVSEAGWSPRYNIRAEGIDQPIELEYMAKVFNNTAIDWKDIDIVLSTGNPFKSLTIPSLDAWTLNYNRRYNSYQNQGYRKSKGEGYLNKQRAKTNSYNNEYKVQQLEIDPNSNETVDVEVSEITVDFKIKEKYSIPADNKPYLVDVNTHKLPASYKYYTIPKLECDAFLMANVTEWEKVNLIDSYANIYYKGKYIGESFISTDVANDTLAFSLGRDSKINISRVKKEDFNKKKWIGLNRTESFEYEISIRNTYNTPIEIEVIDQVPVSQESDIEVDVKEISKAEHDVQSGRLKWKLNINPKTTKKLTTAFSVKYPKSKKVKIRKKRKIATPKYRF